MELYLTSQGIDPNSDYARALATNVTGITVNDVDLTQVHRMLGPQRGADTVNGSSVQGFRCHKNADRQFEEQENFTNNQKLCSNATDAAKPIRRCIGFPSVYGAC